MYFSGFCFFYSLFFTRAFFCFSLGSSFAPSLVYVCVCFFPFPILNMQLEPSKNRAVVQRMIFLTPG